MKVLIVDPQAVSRNKLHRMLDDIGDCDSVNRGKEALAACEEAVTGSKPFDLITLDIALPDMDGIQLIEAVRNLERKLEVAEKNRSKILVVASDSYAKQVINCVRAGCDEYLVKPVSRERLIRKMEHLGLELSPTESTETEETATIDQMIETTVQRFKEGNLDLPAMPQVVKELQQVMSSPTAGLPEMAAVIEKDPAIAAGLISKANSPVYRGVGPVKNVSMAISRIGMKESQEVVNTIANKGFYGTRNRRLKEMMEAHWTHSLACAHASKIITRKVFPDDLENAFMKGMLHDIGSVLLLKSLDENLSGKTPFSDSELIDCIYEVHSSFGAALLERWEFTPDFIRIVKAHEWTTFPSDTEKDILIANLADNLVHKISYGIFKKEDTALPDLESARLLELDPAALNEICEEVKSLMKDTRGDL